jgi:hypothetical protein
MAKSKSFDNLESRPPKKDLNHRFDPTVLRLPQKIETQTRIAGETMTDTPGDSQPRRSSNRPKPGCDRKISQGLFTSRKGILPCSKRI